MNACCGHPGLETCCAIQRQTRVIEALTVLLVVLIVALVLRLALILGAV